MRPRVLQGERSFFDLFENLANKVQTGAEELLDVSAGGLSPSLGNEWLRLVGSPSSIRRPLVIVDLCVPSDRVEPFIGLPLSLSP
jgi:hypothetical protein